MIEFFLQSLNPVKIYVSITLLFALTLGMRNDIHRLLLAILCFGFANEAISSILLFNGYKIRFSATLYIIIHHSLWLLLLGKKATFKNSIILLLLFFLAFSFYNLFFLEGMKSFNFNSFIVGAFIYILAFTYESFYHLRKENFTYFTSNHYILLLSPLLYFFGVSFVFGFKSKTLAETVIFGGINLYNFLINFVNFIYYFLICVYIYREKKLKYGE